MLEAAKLFFDSLSDFKDINKLLEDGEAEHSYLECKTHSGSRVNQDVQKHLAKAISGFSNSEGGVVIYGVSTSRNESKGLDLLTEIIPIANVVFFAKELANKIPTLTSPNINYELRIVRKKKTETRGLVLIFVPKSKGDPARSLKDEYYYFRSGDEFQIAPHEMIKRLFAASESPDLHFRLNSEAITYDKKIFRIPITVENLSSAIGEYCVVQVEVVNAINCQSIEGEGLGDISDINPGKKIYSVNLNGVVHRGIGIIVGKLIVGMGMKKKLVIKVWIFANKMIPRVQIAELILNSKKPASSLKEEKLLFV